MNVRASKQEVDAARGDEVPQSTATQLARFVQFKAFEEATGELLAAALRAWCVDTLLNPEREIVDITYRVDGGVHYALLLWAV